MDRRDVTISFLISFVASFLAIWLAITLFMPPRSEMGPGAGPMPPANMQAPQPNPPTQGTANPPMTPSGQVPATNTEPTGTTNP